MFLYLYVISLQGHAVESSMPPLPENGPTTETAVVDLDPSPVPSANSREEETAEATEETQPTVSKKSKRRKIRLAPSSSSSPSKDAELKDDACLLYTSDAADE